MQPLDTESCCRAEVIKWEVLYSCQDLQALPSFPGLHSSNKAHLTQSEPFLGFRCWRGLWVTLPSYKKVTFILNITFTRISQGELTSLLGHSSLLQTQLLFSFFFPSSCPWYHILQIVGLPAPRLVLFYLLCYFIFFFNLKKIVPVL